MKSTVSEADSLFKDIKSYSPEEVFAAGGTTAFGLKTGKTFDALIKTMEELPKPEPFTDDEWADLMEDMKKNK